MSKHEVDYNIIDGSSHDKILRMVGQGSKVLEFGPSAGAMTKYLAEELGCEVYIVELDHEDFEKARRYAFNGYCGDIETYEWEQNLIEIGIEADYFDYVLFADVLEHLFNPQKALKRSKRFLKTSGHVLVSLPNIAHADIIMNLHNNAFNYTSVGLLDSTHIRFFAYNNLHEFARQGGYSVVSEDFTFAEPFNTEQAGYLPLAKSAEFLEVIKNHDLGDIYQFILDLQKSEYVDSDSIGFESKVKANLAHWNSAMFFFDVGDGFNQDCSAPGQRSFNGDGFQNVRVDDIPRGTVRVRFDPVANHRCYIRDLKALGSGGTLICEPINGVRLSEDEILFMTDDPQLLLEDIGDTAFIELHFRIISFNDRQYQRLFGDYASVRTEAEELALRLQRQTNEMRQLELESEARVSLLKEQLDDVTGKLEQSQAKNDLLINQQSHQILQKDATINELMNSTSWRVTKPLRALGKLLKRNESTEYHSRQTEAEQAESQLIDADFDYTGFNLAVDERESQMSHSFDRDILISVLVPLFNTPEAYLREMIESVLNQTYARWELCLADASDGEQASRVQAVCQEYMAEDQRIQYRKLEANAGIAENTNQCIAMSKGEYLALLDHDDVLHPSALFEVMKVICDQDADLIYSDEITFTNDPHKGYNPHFKPDFSPDTLRSYNYICHLTVFSRELQTAVGLMRSEYNGSQDYDLILRLSEQAKNVVHIARVLYYWRAHENSVASGIDAKPYAIDAAKNAIAAHLERIGLKGTVADASIPTTYHVQYELDKSALVSIIIPTSDHIDDLDTCLRSIVTKTSYPNIEILILENNSKQAETFDYYQALPALLEGLKENGTATVEPKRIEVINWIGDFNFSAINNHAARLASGEYLLFLNNDIEVITEHWIDEMLMFAQRDDIAAVGARLLYRDDTVQHAGVIVGVGGVAGHAHKYLRRDDYGYASRLQIAQNLSAVTAACLLVSKQVFDQVGGFDEDYRVAFNDVDLCMKFRRAGYYNVFTPFAELYHHESKSRGYEDTLEKQKRFSKEVARFKQRWHAELEAGDPFYNPNLSLEREDFSLREDDSLF